MGYVGCMCTGCAGQCQYGEPEAGTEGTQSRDAGSPAQSSEGTDQVWQGNTGALTHNWWVRKADGTVQLWVRVHLKKKKQRHRNTSRLREARVKATPGDEGTGGTGEGPWGWRGSVSGPRCWLHRCVLLVKKCELCTYGVHFSVLGSHFNSTHKNTYTIVTSHNVWALFGSRFKQTNCRKQKTWYLWNDWNADWICGEPRKGC